METSRFASEQLEISPFHLGPSGAHGCDFTLRDRTQRILETKEVGVYLRPVDGLSNITGVLALAGEEPLMFTEAINRVGFDLTRAAGIKSLQRRRPNSSDAVHQPRARPSREVPERRR